MNKPETNNERGSLALEQILFIGAVIAISAGVYAFYDDINDYYNGVNLGGAPTLAAPGDTIGN